MPEETDLLAASGRSSLSKLRDKDFEDFVRAVRSLPAISNKYGKETAIAWARIELRSLLDILALIEPSDPEIKQAQHRVHLLLAEGTIRLMLRADTIGFRARTDFMVMVERYFLAPSIREVFAKSLNDSQQRTYKPQTEEIADESD